MIQKVGVSKVRTTAKLMLNKNKKTNLVNKKFSLPAGKELRTDIAEHPKRTKIFASTKCSEYEPFDYCSPLFP